MAHYLVTGGAGFIGSHLVEELVRRGDRVRVVDNLVTGHMENLAVVAGRVEFIEGDLARAPVAAAAARGVDYVLHQAAIPSVPRSVAEPSSAIRPMSTPPSTCSWPRAAWRAISDLHRILVGGNVAACRHAGSSLDHDAVRCRNSSSALCPAVHPCMAWTP
jgi:NAD(P)-dependent dehydrogenase (short-subunit alcohol dehydrogenase family)